MLTSYVRGVGPTDLREALSNLLQSTFNKEGSSSRRPQNNSLSRPLSEQLLRDIISVGIIYSLYIFQYVLNIWFVGYMWISTKILTKSFSPALTQSPQHREKFKISQSQSPQHREKFKISQSQSPQQRRKFKFSQSQMPQQRGNLKISQSQNPQHKKGKWW